MELFDLLVLGGGPGGYLCAERAAQGGMKVCLFEKKALGGTCLNEGCIPTKTLLNSSKMYRHAKESEAFGVTAENVKFDHAKVIDRKDKVVKTLVAGVGATMKANKVTVISANAVIKGKSANGFSVEADGVVYEGKKLVIASGSEAFVPPVPGLREGLESGFVVTNREVLDCKKLPENLVVIGGGVIGLEMAYYFASVGTKVTVIEMMPKIAGATDPEICKVIQDSFTKRGMEFKLSCKVLEVTKNTVIYEDAGEKKEIACDMVLLSSGRKPATEGIGIETLHVEMDRAAVKTDRFLCTNVSGVYAIGDCNGKLMLAHTAYREAEVAVNHMLGIRDEMRYDVVPSVIYTDPEVASVGLSIDAAKEKGINAKEVKLPMSYAGRYLAETEGGKGFIKIVVDQDKKRLIGCHMVGSYASEIIMTATMMVDTELTPTRLQKLVFPHPTVAEIIREAIFHI
ncbi:MAG: dihydrolipoyl dehydrogenase [Clostridia bacterium]|nr:dihydrolipoyl dehydrogenase [Clostridia bacterium]